MSRFGVRRAVYCLLISRIYMATACLMSYSLMSYMICHRFQKSGDQWFLLRVPGSLSKESKSNLGISSFRPLYQPRMLYQPRILPAGKWEKVSKLSAFSWKRLNMWSNSEASRMEVSGWDSTKASRFCRLVILTTAAWRTFLVRSNLGFLVLCPHQKSRCHLFRKFYN